MKTNPLSKTESYNKETKAAGTIALQRAKEIMTEEGIDYTEEELTEVLYFVSTVVSVTTAHYERRKQNEAKVISIHTNTTHETTSHSLHPREHRRAS